MRFVKTGLIVAALRLNDDILGSVDTGLLFAGWLFVWYCIQIVLQKTDTELEFNHKKIRIENNTKLDLLQRWD